MIRYSFVYFVFLTYFSSTNALKCYTCSYTQSDMEESCASSPDDEFLRDCNKKYCNIVRVENKDPIGGISSLSRSCSDFYMNGFTEDQSHKIYQMSCRDDYCNSGSGKSTSHGNQNYIGDKSTIYCPGSESSGQEHITIWIPLLIMTFIMKHLL